MSTSSIGSATQAQTAQTVTTAQTSSADNLYGYMSVPTMANDFFGAQAFGNNYTVANTTGVTTSASVPQQTAQVQQTVQAQPTVEIPNIFDVEPDNYASAILQQFALSQIPSTSQAQPTQTSQTAQISQTNGNAYANASMNDYLKAQQIANLFVNDTPMVSPYTTYFQRDMFAQRALDVQNMNSQNNNQTTNASYIA
jgi:hypothetical protein